MSGERGSQRRSWWSCPGRPPGSSPSPRSSSAAGSCCSSRRSSCPRRRRARRRSPGPTITTFWLGGLSLGFATAVMAIFAAFFGWLVIGGWVAAVTERDLISLVATDDELGAGSTIPRPSGSRRRGRIWRIVLLRFAAYVPLALALGYGSLRLVQATYRELTLPSDVVTPIVWRVIATVPEPSSRSSSPGRWARRSGRSARGGSSCGASRSTGVLRRVGRHAAPAAVHHGDVRAADGRDGAARRADRARVRRRTGNSCGPSLQRPPGRTQRSCSCRC